MPYMGNESTAQGSGFGLTEAVLGAGMGAATQMAGFGGYKQSHINPNVSLGRQSLIRGTKESFGWAYEGGKNKGFLGLGKTDRMGTIKKIPSTLRTTYATKGAGAVFGKILGAMIGPANLAFMGMSAYSGYKDNGVMGAATGAIKHIALNSGAHRGMAAIVGTSAAGVVMGALSVGAIAGTGLYAFGEAAQSYKKSREKLEFGSMQSLETLNSTGARTQRAAAQSALESSHMNARMALGNEAALLHSVYR